MYLRSGTLVRSRKKINENKCAVLVDLSSPRAVKYAMQNNAPLVFQINCYVPRPLVICATRYSDPKEARDIPAAHVSPLRSTIFFRAGREGPLGVTRILRPVSSRLRHSSLLSPRFDRVQELENAYYSYCDTLGCTSS